MKKYLIIALLVVSFIAVFFIYAFIDQRDKYHSIMSAESRVRTMLIKMIEKHEPWDRSLVDNLGEPICDGAFRVSIDTSTVRELRKHGIGRLRNIRNMSDYDFSKYADRYLKVDQ